MLAIADTRPEVLKLSKEARFSLEHAENLLASCSEDDVQEMQRVVLRELAIISGQPEVT